MCFNPTIGIKKHHCLSKKKKVGATILSRNSSVISTHRNTIIRGGAGFREGCSWLRRIAPYRLVVRVVNYTRVLYKQLCCKRLQMFVGSGGSGISGLFWFRSTIKMRLLNAAVAQIWTFWLIKFACSQYLLIQNSFAFWKYPKLFILAY